MEIFIANASEEQRCVLGFPKPGHPYWANQTLLAVVARYEKLIMDMTLTSKLRFKFKKCIFKIAFIFIVVCTYALVTLKRSTQPFCALQI